MPDRVDKYLDVAADQALDQTERVDDKRGDVGEIYQRCLESPELRNDGIADWTLSYMEEQMELATGNPQLASAYWDEIAEYHDLSIEDIMSIPPDERDDTWHTGRAFVSMVCQRQAYIESGLAYEDLVNAQKNAIQNQVLFNRMDSAQIKKVAVENNKKERMKQKKEERKNGREN